MLVRGLLVLVSFAAAAFAAPVPKSLKASPSKVDTARFKVNYQKAPFDRVFEDFAEGTGLEWVGDRPNLGTISLRPNREYSGVEFLDLINDMLEKDNYCVVRHAGTFYLQAAAQPIDLEKVDTVSADDIIPRPEKAKPAAKPATSDWADGGGWNGNPWARPPQQEVEKKEPPKRGKSEVATLLIGLPTGLAYADIRPQLKKSLSPFGRMDVDERGELRITDRVDNLRLVARILTDEVKHK